jgi:hypothetical protein
MLSVNHSYDSQSYYLLLTVRAQGFEQEYRIVLALNQTP